MERKQKYMSLHADPKTLFSDCYVVLFPVERNEIWIGDGDKCGFRLIGEKTEKGLCLHVTNFDGSPLIKVFDDNDKEAIREDLTEVRICQDVPNEPPPKSSWRRKKTKHFRRILKRPNDN
jgi:hypothetical protein